MRDMRSYYSHAEAGAWEKQKGAPRPFRCQVVQAAPRLTLAASLLPVAQRTSGSIPLRAKPLRRGPASASAEACNSGSP